MACKKPLQTLNQSPGDLGTCSKFDASIEGSVACNLQVVKKAQVENFKVGLLVQNNEFLGPFWVRFLI